MAWQNVILDYGHEGCSMREVHTAPVCDSRMHTIPMCWCRPVTRANGQVVHNAESVPD